VYRTIRKTCALVRVSTWVGPAAVTAVISSVLGSRVKLKVCCTPETPLAYTSLVTKPLLSKLFCSTLPLGSVIVVWVTALPLRCPKPEGLYGGAGEFELSGDFVNGQ
jgi:hypothetical protein